MAGSESIGVFDSGVGGLTVVREIMKSLPMEQIVYFGDTARVPYGSKSKETITAYSKQVVHFLLSKNVKAIVIACNTATALALDAVSKEVSIPVVDVIAPGAVTAAKATKNGHIGVIATEATIRSGMYERILKETAPFLSVHTKACPLLVPLVEEGWVEDPVTKEVVRRYLGAFDGRGVDTLVLGCTHYPLLYTVISEIAGEDVVLVDPAYETAAVLARILQEKGLLRHSPPRNHQFYVSDGAEKFRDFANTILSCEMQVTKEINIETFA